MKANEYVTLHVKQTRWELRASSFLKNGYNSREHSGKTSQVC